MLGLLSAGFCNSIIPRFLQNLHTVFHSGSINLQTHQWGKRTPFSPAHGICGLLDNGHSDWCELISFCMFDCYFSNNEQCWASFHVFISHLYAFFGEVYLGLLVLFDWVVCFSGIDFYELYISELILCQVFHLLLFSPILRVIFSPCLLFAMQKFLS